MSVEDRWEQEHQAAKTEAEWTPEGDTPDDFVFDTDQGKFWSRKTGKLLSANGMDAEIPRSEWPRTEADKLIKPSVDIANVDTGQVVSSSTWWPGEPLLIRDAVFDDTGKMPVGGKQAFNMYRPPRRKEPPVGVSARPWVDHVRRLYPEEIEHEHFFDFCAHCIQHPEEKVNHGIVLAGAQGIGKDTMLWPVRMGVGIWNTAEIDPDYIHSQFNAYVKSVLLTVNEVRPHNEDFKASNFYNAMKPLLAAGGDMLAMNQKHQKVIYVPNVCHVVLTTNEPMSLYIPAEDRRLFVMSSPLKAEELKSEYYDKLWHFLQKGGVDVVIAWLESREIKFKPKACPPMTSGKKAVIAIAEQVRWTPVDELIDSYIEKSSASVVIFVSDLERFVHNDSFDDLEALRKKLWARDFPRKMDEHGYEGLRRNGKARFILDDKKTASTAYVSKEVPAIQRLAVAEAEADKRRAEAEKRPGRVVA